MNINSSLKNLEKIICFEKSKRTKNCSILGVKKGMQGTEIVLVSGQDLTTWNFVRKFFGFGPLAGIDLHIRSVNSLLEKNWSTISNLLSKEQVNLKYEEVAKRAQIINNIVNVIRKGTSSTTKNSTLQQLGDIQSTLAKQLTISDQLKELLDEKILIELPVGLIAKIEKKLSQKDESTARFIALLKDLKSLSAIKIEITEKKDDKTKTRDREYHPTSPEKIKEFLTLLFSQNELLPALFKDNTLEKEVEKLLENPLFSNLDQITKEIADYVGIYQHSVFKKMIKDRFLTFDEFVNRRLHHDLDPCKPIHLSCRWPDLFSLKNNLDAIDNLPASFFKNISWVSYACFYLTNTYTAGNESIKNSLIESLTNLSKEVEVSAEALAHIPLIYQMISLDEKERNESLSKVLSEYDLQEQNYLKKEINFLAAQWENITQKKASNIFRLFLFPKGHFIKLEKELDKGLRIEDKKSSNYIVENLIRILLQKPLNQQEEWLNSILKALESEFPIPEEDLSLLNFSYLEKFSIEEFKKDIELDSLHSSFPLFLRLCSDDFILIKENDLTDIFINLLKELSPLGFDEVYLILEYLIRSNWEYRGLISESIIKKEFNKQIQKAKKQIQEGFLTNLSSKIKLFFDLNNPEGKENYFYVMKALVDIKNSEVQDFWLNWITELFGKDSFQFFVNVKIKNLNLDLQKLKKCRDLFNNFFKGKLENQEKEDEFDRCCKTC